jgi:hypothetical protein
MYSLRPVRSVNIMPNRKKRKRENYAMYSTYSQDHTGVTRVVYKPVTIQCCTKTSPMRITKLNQNRVSRIVYYGRNKYIAILVCRN